ncbi:MAG: ribonuclease HI [Pseudomonadota bacterium]|jgi:ribonuclease HI|nr:ribonuclease HI [Rhodobiaceae bacterium]MEC9074809.1 ribonuclease HI [Pseudomonadota bacterium]MED5272658.1 ribonuclease HI [Pseudomonadota bacterium]|tara:strand:+ start:504 stop:938 length:435 start_codon:yes stop_codon:yes gene_type:complete
MNKKVDIYTDGACSGNPGPGGWGVLIQLDDKNIELSGGDNETTNNRMELMAAIIALEEINKDYKINLYTDSNYVKDGITSWISNWKKNSWKTANKKDVKNKDLWIRLDSAIKGKDISWIWVKGHAGNAGNEQADYLARSALEKL